MMKLYFAAPLFNTAEKEFNQNLVNKIEKLGIEVFLPQRDGIEQESPEHAGISTEKKQEAIFILDRDKILESDIFLFILDGRVPDEGACVELGIAYTQRYIEKKEKRIVGLQTDVRAAFIGSKLNPMIQVPLDNLFESEDELLDFLGKSM